jgi:hypothetical protein
MIEQVKSFDDQGEVNVVGNSEIAAKSAAGSVVGWSNQ